MKPYRNNSIVIKNKKYTMRCIWNCEDGSVKTLLWPTLLNHLDDLSNLNNNYEIIFVDEENKRSGLCNMIPQIVDGDYVLLFKNIFIYHHNVGSIYTYFNRKTKSIDFDQLSSKIDETLDFIGFDSTSYEVKKLLFFRNDMVRYYNYCLEKNIPYEWNIVFKKNDSYLVVKEKLDHLAPKNLKFIK